MHFAASTVATSQGTVPDPTLPGLDPLPDPDAPLLELELPLDPDPLGLPPPPPPLLLDSEPLLEPLAPLLVETAASVSAPFCE